MDKDPRWHLWFEGNIIKQRWLAKQEIQDLLRNCRERGKTRPLWAPTTALRKTHGRLYKCYKKSLTAATSARQHELNHQFDCSGCGGVICSKKEVHKGEDPPLLMYWICGGIFIVNFWFMASLCDRLVRRRKALKRSKERCSHGAWYYMHILGYNIIDKQWWVLFLVVFDVMECVIQPAHMVAYVSYTVHLPTITFCDQKAAFCELRWR